MKLPLPFRAALVGVFLLFLFLLFPFRSLPWGAIDEIRYKIKSIDGNRWADRLGNGYVVKGEESPGTVTFTFDDGPDHRTTPVLLNQLDRYGVKAVFFVNGAKFHIRTAGGPENQAILREIYRRGHFIGNHTFNHKSITGLDDQGWRTEVHQVEQVLTSLTGKRPWLFRPPFGQVDSRALERLAVSGYTVVMWNLDPKDWKAQSAEDLFRRSREVLRANPQGGVFLFHDTNQTTVEAFPLILEWIQEQNASERAQGKAGLEIVGVERFVNSKRH